MGFAKRLADFENTQIKRSYLLSSKAGSDSTHSTHSKRGMGRGGVVPPLD